MLIINQILPIKPCNSWKFVECIESLISSSDSRILYFEQDKSFNQPHNIHGFSTSNMNKVLSVNGKNDFIPTSVVGSLLDGLSAALITHFDIANISVAVLLLPNYFENFKEVSSLIDNLLEQPNKLLWKTVENSNMKRNNILKGSELMYM